MWKCESCSKFYAIIHPVAQLLLQSVKLVVFYLMIYKNLNEDLTINTLIGYKYEP